eukprot:600404-Pleurochrysis_carterae.AAC.1
MESTSRSAGPTAVVECINKKCVRGHRADVGTAKEKRRKRRDPQIQGASGKMRQSAKAQKPSPPAASTRSKRLRPLLARKPSKCCARWAVLQVSACDNSTWTQPTFKVHSKEMAEKCTSAPLPVGDTITVHRYGRGATSVLR